tara:strand:- start:117 stop:275 length:159 start_codon:yes stop_codon:yes gene_type:complete
MVLIANRFLVKATINLISLGADSLLTGIDSPLFDKRKPWTSGKLKIALISVA